MIGKTSKQQSLFLPNLKVMLNPKHELYQLSEQIDWQFFETNLEKYYIDFGRPSKPIRLMVSLLILKQIFNQSDETVVDEWVQNPYYQYFSGEETFQWKFPCTPSDLTHFRNRIGVEGIETIFKNSIDLHGNAALEKEVFIDSTVQEKNITYPTDFKLYGKILEGLRKIAKNENIKLRQSYVRIQKQHLLNQRFRNHPKNYKKATKSQKQLKTIAGRLLREISRKMSDEQRTRYSQFFQISIQILEQKRGDKNKIYSLHEPEVHCISKGKAHKKYEYGTKASIVVGRKSGVILGALNIHNQHDGKSLPGVLAQVRKMIGDRIKCAIVDRGYTGVKKIGNTVIEKPSVPKRKATDYEKRKQRLKFRGRAGIEPRIGHLKSDHRMARNYLKGSIGDDINILLSAAAFNYKKKMNQLKFNFCQFLYRLKYQILGL
jgi:IS5 family transposase